jgi:DNA-directed RNA polymerase specialized sigma24 family protein
MHTPTPPPLPTYATRAPACPSAARSRHVLRRLQHDWDRDRHHPDRLAAARGWHLVDGPITSLDDVLVAVGLGTRHDPQGNERLRRLVTLAPHDDLAARAVLQRILPNLSAVARRHHAGRSPGHPEVLELLEDLVATAWTVIRTYDPGRHPSSVAEALADDCRLRVLRAGARRRWTVEYVPSRQLDRSAHDPVEPIAELCNLLVDARRAGLSDDDLAFVRTYVSAGTTRDVAAALQVTERTVRNRRDAVVARLRVLLAA